MKSSHRIAVAGLSGVIAVGAFLVTTPRVQAESFAGAAPVVQAGAAAPVVSGCAIRFTASGPAIHTNTTHRCDGATSVAVDANGDLVIASAPRGAIISVTAEEDETLSRKGIQAGASGGIGRTVVRFYSTRTGTPVRADDLALQDPYANLWMTWVNAG